MSEISTPTQLGNIVWRRHDLETAELSYRGHLRYLQGAPLSELFLPLVLVRGTPDRIWRVPFVLRDVTLAEVLEAPAGMTPQQISLELMKIALATARGS
jgi:hypothetical protein